MDSNILKIKNSLVLEKERVSNENGDLSKISFCSPEEEKEFYVKSSILVKIIYNILYCIKYSFKNNLHLFAIKLLSLIPRIRNKLKMKLLPPNNEKVNEKKTTFREKILETEYLCSEYVMEYKDFDIEYTLKMLEAIEQEYNKILAKKIVNKT